MAIEQHSNDLVTRDNQLELYRETQTAITMEKVIAGGDLSKLTAQERLIYYRKTCESCGLNPLTKPFIYITLTGKLVLYPVKECAEQLRMIHGVATKVLKREAVFDNSIYQVSVFAQDRTGRSDEAVGAVAIAGLKGQDLANALMKAETKAKRRVTFSICGLGWMADQADEIESQRPYTLMDTSRMVDTETGEITDDLDPSLADIHDPAKDQAAYAAKADLIATIRRWGPTQDMAWEPIQVIFDDVIRDLETKFGPMNEKKWHQLADQKWLDALYQKIIDSYDAVSMRLRYKAGVQPVTKPENDPASDAWEKMLQDPKAEAPEREPGEEG